MISQNQAEFLRVLNTPIPEEGSGGGGGGGGSGGMGGVPPGLLPGMPGAGGGGGPPGTISIPVTAQEKEAIDRVS